MVGGEVVWWCIPETSPLSHTTYDACPPSLVPHLYHHWFSCKLAKSPLKLEVLRQATVGILMVGILMDGILYYKPTLPTDVTAPTCTGKQRQGPHMNPS